MKTACCEILHIIIVTINNSFMFKSAASDGLTVGFELGYF
jgi:hypothetical protein